MECNILMRHSQHEQALYLLCLQFGSTFNRMQNESEHRMQLRLKCLGKVFRAWNLTVYQSEPSALLS